MKTISFESNFGNFDYTATITLPDEELSVAAVNIARKGIANEMYRAAGSAVEKEFEVEFPLVKSRDKNVPADQRGRRAIPHTAATLAKFTKVVNEKCATMAKDDGEPLITVVVSEVAHEYGAAGDKPTAEATEMWTRVQALKPEEKFQAALKSLGLAEDYTDETGILACKKKLTEAKAAAKLQTNALLGI